MLNPYRLPRSVVPLRYDLHLAPDLTAATFDGQLCIAVDVREAVSEVWLNAAELVIGEVTFTADARTWSATAELQESSERCRLSFTESLPLGQGQLRLTFRGTLNDKLRGFYRSKFRATSGEWRWLAATQFEATDARRAFPCWDEPDFKAVFAFTLQIDAELQAVSNTAVVEDRTFQGKRQVRFADTIPMSTYLAAFIVGPLEASEPRMVGNTPVRIWTVPGKQRLTRFAGDIAVASLAFFEEYYGRKYPSDKLDLIAIPDFAAGAMENLGAITFRETALLVDEATATHSEKERVADVVAHENAHMWFGDLVTMRWWNGLWLNEAFATFMEMLAVDRWRPQWRRWETFGVSRSAAMVVDGLQSTRPIEFPVEAPSDAEAMFDVLTYEKGASILRMLEQYIGTEAFREGVRLYLTRHAFGSTETNDLWNALEAATQIPIPRIMNDWVFKPGYPLLTARREGRDVVVRQQRFSYLPSDAAAQIWFVPVQVRIDSPTGRESRGVLVDQDEVRLALPESANLVLLNEGGHGFFRVRYEGELATALTDRLSSLAAIERFNLVNDTWAAVQAGLAPLEEFLDLTARFSKERDRNVWSVLLGALGRLSLLIEEEDRPSLQQMVRERLRPTFEALGWSFQTGDDELTGQLRGELLRALGTLGDDADVQSKATRLFTSGKAEASVQAALVAILAHTGDGARYDEFLARFRSATTPQEEQRYLLALAAFRPQGLVERTLGLTLDGSIRTQDGPFVLRALLLGAHSRTQAWAFLQTQWEQMSKMFPGPGIRRLCEGVLGLVTPEWETQVKAFFHERNINLGGKTQEQYLEQLHIAVRLRQREGANLKAYLRNGGKRAI